MYHLFAHEMPKVDLLINNSPESTPKSPIAATYHRAPPVQPINAVMPDLCVYAFEYVETFTSYFILNV